MALGINNEQCAYDYHGHGYYSYYAVRDINPADNGINQGENSKYQACPLGLVPCQDNCKDNNKSRQEFAKELEKSKSGPKISEHQEEEQSYNNGKNPGSII